MAKLRVISEEEVRRLATSSFWVQAIQEAYLALSQETVKESPRQRTILNGSVIHSLSALCEEHNLGVTKTYCSSVKGVSFTTVLMDMAQAQSLAIIESDYLSGLRTAAASFAVVERLFPHYSNIGIIGSGKIARFHAKVWGELAPHCSIKLWSPNLNQDICQHRLSDITSEARVTYTSSLSELMEEIELLLLCTTAQEPVFSYTQLPETVTGIVATGANWPRKTEVDLRTLQSCGRIFLDNRQQADKEVGHRRSENKYCLEQGVMLTQAWNEPTRTSGRVLFRSLGTAVQDLAVAKALWLGLS